MSGFKNVVGQEAIKNQLSTAIKTNAVFHAYLFHGENGLGKKAMAKAFAATLMCESKTDSRPCGTCRACKQEESGNNPDIVWIIPEKASIGVDDIRAKINQTIDIKPYSSDYKVYVIDKAERMTTEAQNALLKTLEEPPVCAVIILLTSSLSAILPTIVSRCINLEFRPIGENTVIEYLQHKLKVPDYLAKTSATFAQGNLGRAIRYATSEHFLEKKDIVFDILRHSQELPLSDMIEKIRDIGQDKDRVTDYIDLMVMWYRDVLLFKATKDMNQLLFGEEYSYILKEATKRDYEKIEEILDAFQKAKVRLEANVNFEVVMELMLLTLKEN